MKPTKCVSMLIAFLLAFAVGGANAQSFPSKTVRIVVPLPAGGLADVFARAIAQDLTKTWGQPVIVDNRPGANGIIAAQATTSSPADGHTIFMANDTPISINPFLYTKLPYDPVKDFVPVINLIESIQLLAVSTSFPATSVKELIAMAKAKPASITYASFGLGSITHLDTEEFASVAGIKLHHIPYKGIADALPALVGGQVDIALVGIPPAIPFIRSGKLKIIAVAGPERLPMFPDVPTYAELGIPNVESRAWFGFVVRSGTPRSIVDEIASQVSRIIVRPEFKEKYVTSVGMSVLDQGPDRFAAMLKEDRAKYEGRIKKLNFKLD